MAVSKYECKVKELQKLAYENHLQSNNPKFKQLEKEIHEEQVAAKQAE